MAKMMKAGLRVTRGSDWNYTEFYELTDGNGPGTVVNEHPTEKNVWLVKWDKTGKTDDYWITELKIIDTTQPAHKKTFSIGKKLLMAPSTFDLFLKQCSRIWKQLRPNQEK